MARIVLNPPDNNRRPFNTGDGTEFGDNPRTIINNLNTMLAELYAGGGAPTSGITAGTTRTQAGATALTTKFNRVDTSTAPSAGSLLGDGVALPAAAAGDEVVVTNNTANPIQVYGNGSDTINGVAGATGIAIPPNSSEIFFSFTTGSWFIDGGVGSSGQLNTVLALDGISAAGTNQGGATALTADFNRVTTVAANAGVVLPASAPGLDIYVVNHGANALKVYPAGTDKINDGSASAAVSQMVNSVVLYTCYAAGNWYSEGLSTGFSSNLQTLNFADALTALTGGQGSALQLAALINRVTTCPSSGGVNLPASAAGLVVVVINQGANPLTVFPAQGASDTINGNAAATGVALMTSSVGTFYCTVAGTWVAIGVGQGFSGSLTTQSFADGLTAHAGGGQGSALAITTEIARFTTVANGTFGTNDSAVLPASAAGMVITVINAAAANTMDVFPATSESINGQANNIAFPIPAGTVVTFYCTLASKWHALVTPTGTSVSMRLVHSLARPPFASAPATDAGLFNATPSSTETYLSEVFVPAAGVATGVGILNGSAVSGNVTVFLLDASGQQIAKSASTAQAGTTAYQRVNFSAAKYIAPGTYYIGLQVDNGTGRYTAHVFGDAGAGKLTGTTYGTFPSGQAMPTTFTANLGPVAHLF